MFTRWCRKAETDLLFADCVLSILNQDYPTIYVAREKIVVDDKAIEAAIIEKVNFLKPGLKPSDVSTSGHLMSAL